MSGLSDRMIAVANAVTPGKRVADIGCDHAYISIYLIENGLSEAVIAMDIGEGPLVTARKNIEAAGLGDRIDVRCSDGFEALSRGETDAAVIAGMGGSLIISILEKGREIISPGYELVLSPQSDIKQVREYLRNNKYNIKEEIMIRDSGKLYNIIRVIFEPDSAAEFGEDTEVYDTYGEYLLKNPTELFRDFIHSEVSKLSSLIENLKKRDSNSAEDRCAALEHEKVIAERARDMIAGG